MPVRSRSRLSIWAMRPLPDRLTARRSSSSAFQPSRTMPPSVSRKAGSSRMARSTRSATSAALSQRPDMSLNMPAEKARSSRSTWGRSLSEILRATRSRGGAAARAILPASRSRSRTPFRTSRSSRRAMVAPRASATPSWRATIAPTSKSGRRSQERSRRPPGAVTVKSMTSSSVSFVLPSRRLRTSSRLRTVVASRTRWSPEWM